jgi:hypothetical protein
MLRDDLGGPGLVGSELGGGEVTFLGSGEIRRERR